MHSYEMVFGGNYKLNGASYCHSASFQLLPGVLRHCITWAGLEPMFFTSQPPSSGITG